MSELWSVICRMESRNNSVRRRLASLMRHNALPLRHAVNHVQQQI